MRRRYRKLRTKQGRYYAVRNRKGQYVRFTRIGKSLKRDRKRRARIVRPGRGHRGDQKRRR